MGTYLHKFQTEAQFQHDYNTYGEYNEPWVSYTEETSGVAYNNPNPPRLIIPSASIVYHDGTGFKFCSASEWSSSLGTPEGVVVVPNTHTPDGTARIISISGITSAGTIVMSNQQMRWKTEDTDSGLPKLNKVPTWDNEIGGTVGNNGNGYLPSDRFNNVPYGGYSGIYYCSSDYTPYIPSPYNADGSINPDYRNTTSATTANCLSDFDGKANTTALLADSKHRAASACSLYSTSHITAGNWYLPACGELGYIMPKWNEINAALQAVGGVQLTVNQYWSSSESYTYNARFVNANLGAVDHIGKFNSKYVRPFASVLF